MFKTSSSMARLPNISKLPSQPDATSEAAQRADQRAKSTMKAYADVDQCTRPSPIRTGDTVLLKKPPTHKSAPMFDSRPFKVVRLNGNQVVILDEDVSTSGTSRSSSCCLRRSQRPDLLFAHASHTTIRHRRTSQTTKTMTSKRSKKRSTSTRRP